MVIAGPVFPYALIALCLIRTECESWVGLLGGVGVHHQFLQDLHKQLFCVERG